MPKDIGYRSDRGFSPRIVSLLTEDFGRHGADIAGLSDAFRRRGRRMARDAEEARELARLCSAMRSLADRIVTDAQKAKAELAKLAPQDVTLSICRCGRSIEDGSCPTQGHCSRGLVADLTT
jgi:hypothetical protein